MTSMGKCTLPKTVYEVVPYLKTNCVTHNGTIVSVDQVRISSDLASSPNLPLSQYIASVMGSHQTTHKNTVGEFLNAWSNNDTYSELVTVSASSVNVANYFTRRLLAWCRRVLRYCE
jgi:hypothetical protein